MGTRPRFTPRYDLTPLFEEVARRGLTRLRVAKLAGLSRPTVHSAERGGRVSDLTVSRLAAVVGTRREDYIVGIDDNDEGPTAAPSRYPQGVAHV